MAKPTSSPKWTVGNPNFGTVTIEPSAGKKQTGWTAGEKPPHELMNWLFYNLGEWVDYLDTVAFQGFNAVVGTGAGATHPTLAAALADVLVTAGSRILIKEDATINATIQVTKHNIELKFMPGVTYSKGTATTCIQVSADGFKMYGGRFAAWSVGGDKAILIDATSDYSMIRDVRFASCDTEIDDLASTTSVLGTITE